MKIVIREVALKTTFYLTISMRGQRATGKNVIGVFDLHARDASECQKSFNLDNYRPILVLPVLARIFEALIHEQLYAFIEPHLHSFQSGSRQKHSRNLHSFRSGSRQKHSRNLHSFQSGSRQKHSRSTFLLETTIDFEH